MAGRTARILGLAAVVAAALLVAQMAMPPQAGAHQRVIRYKVDKLGDSHPMLHWFALQVYGALNDDRGWGLDGDVAWVRTYGEPDLRIHLATPANVAAAAPGCSAEYSCRVGDDVYVNSERFIEATPTWDRSPYRLFHYQRYSIRHEVGHWIGLRHSSCPAPDYRAPLMQQQSIDLEGCRAYRFPRPGERLAARWRLGIS